MKHINQLLNEFLNRHDAKVSRERQTEAHKAGIAEARRILAEGTKSIHEKQLCTALDTRLAICAREGCETVFETVAAQRRYCRGEECDKARQRERNRTCTRAPKIPERRPPVIAHDMSNRYLAMALIRKSK